MRDRILNVLIALDVFIFALMTLGGSKFGETVSAATWDLLLDGKWQGKLFAPLIDAIFYILTGQKDHCRKAWLWQIDLYLKV